MKDNVTETELTNEPQELESIDLDRELKSSVETLSEREISLPEDFNTGSRAILRTAAEPNPCEDQIINRIVDVLVSESGLESREHVNPYPVPSEKAEQTKNDIENQILICQLKGRIVELEKRGESLQLDKDMLEVSILNRITDEMLGNVIRE